MCPGTEQGSHGSLMKDEGTAASIVFMHYRSHASVSRVVSDSVTPWTVARQARLSVGFSRQKSLGGLPFPPPGDLPDPWIEPESPLFLASQADSLPLTPRDTLLRLFNEVFPCVAPRVFA